MVVVMHNVPKLRFKEFDASWSDVVLGEVANFRRGSFPQPYGSPEWYDDENGMPFVQVFDVADNMRLKPTTKNKISKLAEQASVYVPKGSIVLTIQGSIGRIALTQYDSFVDRTLLIFKSFNVPVSKDFFVYQIYLLFEIEKRKAPGGTLKTITKEALSSFRFALPAVSEQQKIAAFLTSVDTKIEQLTKKAELLKQYKKGVMQKIFSQEIRFKADDGSDFPDWDDKRLGELFQFMRGSSLSKLDLQEEGTTKCVHYGELFTTYDAVIPAIKSRTNLVTGTLSQSGDILMPSSDVTPRGLATASAILEPDVLIGGDINLLRPIVEVDSRFVSYWLNFNKASIMKLVSGTSVKHIYNKDVSRLHIQLPPQEEQGKIACFIASIDAKITELSRTMKLTKTFKKGLLQQMFV